MTNLFVALSTEGFLQNLMSFRRKVEAYARCIDAVNYSVQILGEVIGSQLERLLEVSEKCKSVTKIT